MFSFEWRTFLFRDTLQSTLVAITCLIVFLWIWESWDRITQRRNSPPGPWGWPMIGNLFQMGKDPYVTFTNMRDKYGDIFSFKLGRYNTVVLNGVNTIRKALVNQPEAFAGRPDFHSVRYISGGKSLSLSAYGPRWKLHRQIAGKAMRKLIQNRRNPIEDVISHEARHLVDSLLHNDLQFDPTREIYLSVGSIIYTICFGDDTASRNDKDFVLFLENFKDFIDYFTTGNLVDILPWTRYFTRGKIERFIEINKVRETLRRSKEHEIRQRFDPDNLNGMTDALIKATLDTDDELKEAVGLTDDHILSTIEGLIGAGFSTVATTLSWSVLYMAAHPDIQTDVQNELDKVIGDRDPCASDRYDLPFTDACITEILRHSSILPLSLPHATTRDVILDGFDIPKDTLVLINLWSLTRDPSVFEDPETFNPRRFLTKDGALDKVKMDMFLPFGAGRRRCMGEYLAKLEVFLFFTMLLKKCTIQKPSNVKINFERTFRLSLDPNPFEVMIHLRRQN
ncbi:unnamed protein product [Owenia fusiformis]|uniref:unspecific monooxygenase n=1 Tax=Owenia fusiformis TaxID=6347 RepID=A0A8J1Y6C8_OWEFU|nr:unnamed protein product [Owenia fusiformis]